MNRIVLAAFLLLVVMSGCDDKPPSTPPPETPPQSTAVSDCCQCTSRGSADTPAVPVACFTGTTSQSACDQACGSNRIGGLLQGSCNDGVRCQ
jgi:hypothetical protein